MTLKFENADRIITTNNGFITTGFYYDGLFGIFNSEGELIKFIDTYPPEIKKLQNPVDKYRLGQGALSYNLTVNTVMLATSFLGDFICYEIVDNLIEISRFNLGNNKLLNRISLDNRLYILNDDIRHSLNIVSTSDYYYVLYSGKKLSENDSHLGDMIIKIVQVVS